MAAIQSGRYALLFGDVKTQVYALDVPLRKLHWKVKVDEHASARLTGAPKLRVCRLFPWHQAKKWPRAARSVRAAPSTAASWRWMKRPARFSGRLTQSWMSRSYQESGERIIPRAQWRRGVVFADRRLGAQLTLFALGK